MSDSTTSEVGQGESVLDLRDRLVRSGMIGPAPELDDPAAVRTRVLKSAIKLFADRGFDACTMRDLGEEVGVKAPALYNYFQSKEKILAAASRDALRRFFTAVVGPLAEEPKEDRFESLVHRWVTFQIEERDVARANDVLLDTGVLRRVLPQEDYEEIAGSVRLFVAIVGLLADPVDGVDQELLAVSIAAVCDRSSRWRDQDRALSAEQISDQAWLLCQRMVGA